MTLMDTAQLLGNFGEFFGAIAVLVTLAYLTVQIRHSTNVAKAEAVREANRGWIQAFKELWDDGETARIVRLILRGDAQDLDDEAFMVFGSRMSQLMYHHQAIYDMYHANLIDEAAARRIDNSVLFFLSSPGGRRWWETTGQGFATYSVVNELLTQTADDPSWIDFTKWEEAFINAEKT